MSQVPAADATLRVLSHLAGARGPLPAAAIASALDLPRSTVYHLLSVLQEHGFVVHLPEARRYGLGVAAFELSGGYARQEPLSMLGRPLLAELVDRVGESAHLAVLHGRDVLYIVDERAPRRPHLVTDVGVRLPAHLTASGCAILAALPAGQLRALCVFDDQRMPYKAKVTDTLAWGDIPTCKESGVATDYVMLRGIFMPPGVNKDQLAYYTNLLKKVRETPEWKEYMEKGAFNTTAMSGPEFDKWLTSAETMHRTLMTEAGFISPK